LSQLKLSRIVGSQSFETGLGENPLLIWDGDRKSKPFKFMYHNTNNESTLSQQDR
jgi:hypothetical protein